MGSEAVFILLFVVATAVAIVARRIRVPYTVALVLAGLVLGTVHAVEAPHLTKELLFAVFLPGLIFEAAFHMEFGQFWRNRLAIFSLAVPGVVVAVALTAVMLAPIVERLQVATGFTWHHALAFGALLAATDPIAVVGLFKSMGAPRRLSSLVEGESLLNDGTAIVLFSLVLATILGGTEPTLRDLTVNFAVAVGIGVLVGGGVGLAVSEIMKRIDDPMIEITLTTIAAYGAFVAAEQLHSSGVIATVSAGLLCGNYGARVGMSPSTRIAVESFWEYVAFALNSVVFLLIGFEIRIDALLGSWQIIVIAYLVVMAARAAVIAVVSALLGRTRERLSSAWSLALTWGGLRGALSMVLALSLPADFTQRGLLITMTFGVVLASLLVQGLTMAPLMRWLGLVSDYEHRVEYGLNRARAQAASAALDALEILARNTYAHGDVLDALRGEYRDRLAESEQRLEALPLARGALQREEEQWLRRRLLLVEKERVIDLLRQGVLSPDIYERLIADIDTRLLDLDSGHTQDVADATPANAPPGEGGETPPHPDAAANPK